MPGISREVKLEVLAKVKAGEKVSDLSSQYGISAKTIYNWLHDQVTDEKILFIMLGVQARVSRSIQAILDEEMEKGELSNQQIVEAVLTALSHYTGEEGKAKLEAYLTQFEKTQPK